MASVTNDATLPSSPVTIVLMVLAEWNFHYFMPAYEVAVDEVNYRYPHQFQLQLVSLLRPETKDCSKASADMSNLVSKYYYEGRSTTCLGFIAVSVCKVIFIYLERNA